LPAVASRADAGPRGSRRAVWAEANGLGRRS